MAIALVDKIPDLKVAGLEVGSAAKGLIVAGAGDALGLLINRFSGGKVPVPLIKAGAAWLVQWKPIKEAIGPKAASLGSFLLLAGAVTDWLDLRSKSRKFVAGLIGQALPATGAPANAGANNAAGRTVIKV